MFRVGDKVRYLNEVGQATVRRIVSTAVVEVEDDFGIVHHHPVNQLVPADRDREAPSSVKTVAEKKTDSVLKVIEPIASVAEVSKLPELALAFLAENSQSPQVGDLDLYFINSSDYHMVVNIAAKEERGFFSLFCGEVRAGQTNHIRPIRRQDVDIFGVTMVDCIFYRDADYRHREAFSATLRIKVTRFVKAENFKAVPALGGKAFIVPVERIGTPEHSAAASKAISASRQVASRSASLQVFDEEVDLHIEQITADFSSMSDHEMFSYQMAHFEKKLNFGLTHEFIQITFIHGVGTGRLRDAIRNMLREYNLRFEDGPFQKYGVGATLVHLR